MTTALCDAVARRLGPKVAVAGPNPAALDLWPDEELAMVRAVASRRREFAAGRSAARAAMLALGVPPCPLPMGPHRAPIWPDGIVGSISHSDGVCFAAAAKTQDILALGVDVESAQRLPDEIVAEVLTPQEAQEHTVEDYVLLFSAKEAVFKALFPLSGEIWGFDDVSVRYNGAAREFAATIHRDAGHLPSGTQVCGIVERTAEAVVTAVAMHV